MQKIIAVDMDEVLTETIKSVLKFHNNIFWWSILKYQNITNYNLWKIEGFQHLTVKYCLKYFNDFFLSDEMINAEPIHWAREKLEYFKSLWYRFVVVTGRGSKEIDLETPSKKYLARYYPWIFEEIYFCSYLTDNQKDKYKVCRELGSTTIIEDNLENSIKYAQNGMQVILLDKPRNQEYDAIIHKNITKVYSWDEINL